MKTYYRFLGVLLIALLTLGAVAVGVATLRSSRGDAKGASSGSYEQVANSETPLADDVRAELAERALDYALQWYAADGTKPEVVLVRDLVLDDLLSIGVCPSPNYDPADPRWAIVVLRGDFDLHNMTGTSLIAPQSNAERSMARYMAYIMDATGQHRAPVSEIASPNGGSFRQILGDPSLPDDAPAGGKQVDTAIRYQDCTPVERVRTPIPQDQVLP